MSRFIYWLPVILIAGTIFWFSSQQYHEQDVKPFLGDIINEKWVEDSFQKLKFEYADYHVSVEQLGAASFIEFFIRKGAHFGIFFLLGFFACRAIMNTLLKGRKGSSFFSSFLFIVLYAASDELHQHFTGDRTPLIHDVLLDSFGGLVGIAFYLIVVEVKRKTTGYNPTK
jgi:VanZ family protein